MPYKSPYRTRPTSDIAADPEFLKGRAAGLLGIPGDIFNLVIRDLPQAAQRVAREKNAYSGVIGGPLANYGRGPVIDPNYTQPAAIEQNELPPFSERPFTSDYLAKQMGADPNSYKTQAGMIAGLNPAALLKAAPLLALTKGAKAFQGDAAIVKNANLLAKEFEGSDKVITKRNFAFYLGDARKNMNAQNRAQVSAFDPDNFDGKVFLTDDGGFGFTMDSNGSVGNLFKNPQSNRPGAMSAALTKARAAGAKNLEAFDTYLAQGYKSRGAVETGRLPWSDEYASPEMIKALPGRPDYVQMEIGGLIKEKRIEDVTQKSFERYTPKAQPDSTKLNKKQKTEFKEYVQAGIDQGADRWYWMGGLKDEFMEVLGPQLGAERFNKFMQLNAGVSPRSTVAKEIDRAFVLYRMKYGKGLVITDMTNDMFPSGMGHLATRTAHRSLINRLENTGVLGNPIDQAKVTSFAENLMGNARPVTVDSHNMKLVTGLSRQPYKTEYGYLESLQQGIAKEFGIDPAAVQSAAWVGGADVTGVANARNITQLFNQKFAKVAENLGISEKEAAKRFIKGEPTLMKALLPATVGAGGILALENRKDSESSRALL
tara:strand:- start:2179 stop:3975 length:1797 start_codon:yes stop_codon:yes gene_type:complete